MLALLVISLPLGWTISRHWLKFREWPSLLSATGSLAVVFNLVGTNLFYRQTTDLSRSVIWALGLQLLAFILLLALRKEEPAPIRPLPRWVTWSLVALGAVVLVYTNAQQIANPDDDYWIHAPLQGLMRQSNFPPFNPFFSDIPMNGHYGRNLSIVIFSYLSGTDVFMSQHLLTSGLQVLTLLLFYSAFYQSSDSRSSALLGTFFVFFGINAGGRGGLIDTMQNNNPFVHLYLALLCLLVITTWKRGKLSSAILGGLTLGSYAIVYETHFGLVFFTILGVTPILWASKRIDGKTAAYSLAILAVSLPLAFTQGGPLTDLLERKLEGKQHTQAETLSKGMQNQAQVVKVTFPKKELFQILLETGEYQRTSHIYRLDTPLKVLYKPSTKRGYAYVWSWDVLKIHFLPLYLVPWSAFVLLRRGSFAGLFMGAFGTIAFLVPALVNFGPIYESEYYRWEFAAALGFTAALGLALAGLLEGSKSRPFILRGSQLVMRPAGKRYLAVLLITLLNSWASLHFVSRRLADSISWNPKTWLVFPSTQQWLESHPVLRFDYLDYQAAEWLQERVMPGDRLLVNFAEENNFSILYESTLTGITGARCVGHALPLEDEKIGTTPFRRSPASQLFWQTERPEPLAQLQVDWLFVHADRYSETPKFPGARLVQRFRQGERERLIYRVNQEQLPKLSTEAEPSGKPFPAHLSNVAGAMRGGQVYPLTLRADISPDTAVNGTIILSTIRSSDGLVSSPSENLQLRVKTQSDAEGRLQVKLPFVAPYDEGEYTLEAAFFADTDSPALEIEPALFMSEFTTLLKESKLTELHFPGEASGTLPPRTLILPSARLVLPQNLPQPRTVLACWAFYSTERKEFDLAPSVNMKRIELRPEFNSLPAVTPERPGTYRLSLYLSAGQGHLVRLTGEQVTIREGRP